MSAGPAIIKPGLPENAERHREQLPSPRSQQPHGPPGDLRRFGQAVVVVDRIDVERFGGHGATGHLHRLVFRGRLLSGCSEMAASTRRYSRARREQMRVGAGRGDPALVVHQHDTIGERDRGRAVGDDQRGAAVHDFGERGTDLVLLRGVDRGRGVVEDQHARVGEDGASDREALALPTRQREAVLAEERVVAVGQVTDEVVGTGELCGAHDPLAVGVAFASTRREREVLPDCVTEEERLLEHQADLAPEGTRAVRRERRGRRCAHCRRRRRRSAG